VGRKVDGVLEQGFLYEDQLRIAAELDGSGNVVSRFVYGTRVNVPEYLVKNASTYRIVTDHLGSPRLVLDASDGTVVQRMDYDEFGRLTRDCPVLPAEDCERLHPFGFAGGLYDPDTELVRFGARDYDPQTGRWAAKDPIDFRAGDTCLYAYTLGDPVNLTDPEGLQVLLCGRDDRIVGLGNHVYFYDPATGNVCAKQAIFGMGDFDNAEAGPFGGDQCVPVAGSEGREQQLMECCAGGAGGGSVLPGGVFPFTDCHDVLDGCLEGHGLPGCSRQGCGPGGRFGSRQ
jgi:RHS repeat-associated protein